ncbi:unnamed protein product [Polarella glacialis]|uniref:Uncharacterized protein n=1 Tax=Polarella glacialis TaxID=89957 RepID=A0A813FA95_POLGL|nr:unnamed protein product [Polarella glacialis]
MWGNWAADKLATAGADLHPADPDALALAAAKMQTTSAVQRMMLEILSARYEASIGGRVPASSHVASALTADSNHSSGSSSSSSNSSHDNNTSRNNNSRDGGEAALLVGQRATVIDISDDEDDDEDEDGDDADRSLHVGYASVPPEMSEPGRVVFDNSGDSVLEGGGCVSIFQASPAQDCAALSGRERRSHVSIFQPGRSAPGAPD